MTMEKILEADRSSEALPSSAHGTTIAGMKGRNFIIIVADSRSVYHNFGHVSGNDDTMKLAKLYKNVFVAKAGSNEESDMILGKASTMCSRNGTKQAADNVLKRVEEIIPKKDGNRVGFIIGGTLDNQLYTVARSKDKGESSFSYKVKIIPSYASLGSGKSQMDRFMDENKCKFESATRNAHKARIFIKDAMAYSRRRDFPSDGNLNAMTLFRSGKCRLKTARPVDEDPRSGYCRWKEGTFVLRYYLEERKKKKKVVLKKKKKKKKVLKKNKKMKKKQLFKKKKMTTC